MEKKKLVNPLSPEGDVVNRIADYLNAYGQFNIHKLANLYHTAFEHNSMNMLIDVEKELISQVLEHLRTHAIWEKWGE